MKWKEDHDNSNDNLQTFVTAKIFTLLYAQIQINLNVLPPKMRFPVINFILFRQVSVRLRKNSAVVVVNHNGIR